MTVCEARKVECGEGGGDEAEDVVGVEEGLVVAGLVDKVRDETRLEEESHAPNQTLSHYPSPR